MTSHHITPGTSKMQDCRCDPARPSTRYETIGRIPRHNGAELRVEIVRWGSSVKVDLRVWEATAAGEHRSTRKGLQVSASEAHQLASLLDRAVDATERRRSRRGGGDRGR